MFRIANGKQVLCLLVVLSVAARVAIAQRAGPWCPTAEPVLKPIRSNAVVADPVLAMRLGALVVVVRNGDDTTSVIRDATVRVWGPRGEVRSIFADSVAQHTILRSAGEARLQVRRFRYRPIEARVRWRAGYRDTLRVTLPPLRYCLDRVTTS